MSMTDPIADLLTRIRNAQSAGKPTVGVGASKLKLAILKVLKDEGYIGDYGVETERGEDARCRSSSSTTTAVRSSTASSGSAVRACASTAARTSCRKVLGGLGVAVVSTPQGIMTDRQARAAGTGGEVLFVVQ